MIIEFRFNSKSSGQNVPEAIRIAEQCRGFIEDRFYRVKFEDPQDKDLKKLFELVGNLKGSAIVLDDEETVVARKFLNTVNCPEKFRCNGICRHVKIGYHHIQNFLDDNSEYIENDILSTSEQGLFRFLREFSEQVDEKRFKLNKELFLEHFIRQTEMENRFCDKFNLNKAQREIEKLPNEIKLVNNISVKPIFELSFSSEDLLKAWIADGTIIVVDDNNNKKNKKKKIKATEKSLEDPQKEAFEVEDLQREAYEIFNTKSDEELVEILFEEVKTQADLSSINLGIYWSEIGVENIFNFPIATHYRWEKINNMIWQKVKILKKQRKHERIERERLESFNMIDEIIEWVNEKGLKKLSKINLKLFLSEKKMMLAPVNRQALYLEINRRLEFFFFK